MWSFGGQGPGVRVPGSARFNALFAGMWSFGPHPRELQRRPRFNALFAGMWSFGEPMKPRVSCASNEFQRPFRGHVVFRTEGGERNDRRADSFNALFAGMWSFGRFQRDCNGNIVLTRFNALFAGMWSFGPLRLTQQREFSLSVSTPFSRACGLSADTAVSASARLGLVSTPFSRACGLSGGPKERR